MWTIYFQNVSPLVQRVLPTEVIVYAFGSQCAKQYVKEYVAENLWCSIQKRKMKQSVTVAHQWSKDIQNWRFSDLNDFYKGDMCKKKSICVSGMNRWSHS